MAELLRCRHKLLVLLLYISELLVTGSKHSDELKELQTMISLEVYSCACERKLVSFQPLR